MDGRFSATQLPIPEAMICAEDVAVGKPSPEGYLQAAAALGFEATQSVAIEDAPAGIAGGLAPGGWAP
jgi:mannitol-1-/sugar-/sorbitol-6-phosphatase